MRTTLTIEDDIAKALKDLSHATGNSFKAVTNEVLRRGLTTGAKPAAGLEPFTVVSARRGFRAGIDPLKLNELSDQLQIERFTEKNHGHPQRK